MSGDEAANDEVALDDVELMDDAGPPPAPPAYWAVSAKATDGTLSGDVWTWGNRVMLFVARADAEATATKLTKGEGKDAIAYGVAPISEAYVASLVDWASTSKVEIFVVIGVRGGQIEAIPLAEHRAG